MRVLQVLVLLTVALGLAVGAFAQGTQSGTKSGAKPGAKAPGSAATMLADKHVAKGLACNQCHANAKKPEPVATLKCLTCHDGKALAEKTANLKPTNPHNSRHYGPEADCNLCHRAHTASVNNCVDCHPRFNFKVP